MSVTQPNRGKKLDLLLKEAIGLGDVVVPKIADKEGPIKVLVSCLANGEEAKD